MLSFVVVPLSLSVYLAYGYVMNTNALEEGNTYVKGLSAPVEISRDQHGVVNVVGVSDEDVFFAVGYSHAQDRLWQLEIQRRMTRGQLAEVFGKSAVNFDVYIRTLGIHNNAKKSLAALTPQAIRSLEAYANGINAWINSTKDFPLEFTMLGIQPAHWSPEDSIAWVKMFALSLSGNFQQDLNRMIAMQTLPKEKAQKLYWENYDETVSIGSPPSDKLVNALGLFANFTNTIEAEWNINRKNIGSNAWVISKEHSANGLATLVNDPHLGLELPSQWYAVKLQGKKISASGMTLVGLPVVMLGKNDSIGWGATNMMADTMDLYFEDIDTNNVNQYRRSTGWKEFTTRTEEIQIRSDFPAFLREPLAPIKIKIRETDYGPIISDVIGSLDKPLSLRWIGGATNDTSYDAFLSLNYAASWQQVKDAMSYQISPAMNLFYVDKQQNIGLLGVGKIPIRKSGDGSLPVPGWEAAYDWIGSIPATEMPQSFNPESGYLLSANNKVTNSDYPYFISNDWADPERAERIEQLITNAITKNTKMSLEMHQTFQQDQVDLQALELLPEILTIDAKEPEIKAMLEILNNWDGTTDTQSVASTLFFTWARHIRYELFMDEFTDYWGDPNLKRRQQTIVQELSLSSVKMALEGNELNWCDKTETKEIESCSEIKLDALYTTYNELYKLFDSDLEDWTWGKAQKAVYGHKPFSDIKGLDLFFERSVPAGGSPNSINMSIFSFKPDEGYVRTVGPIFRQLIQLSDDTKTQLLINSTGQSGNVVSPYYDDMIEPFSNGQYYSLSSSKDVFPKTLNLLPTKVNN